MTRTNLHDLETICSLISKLSLSLHLSLCYPYFVFIQSVYIYVYSVFSTTAPTLCFVFAFCIYSDYFVKSNQIKSNQRTTDILLAEELLLNNCRLMGKKVGGNGQRLCLCIFALLSHPIVCLLKISQFVSASQSGCSWSFLVPFWAQPQWMTPLQPTTYMLLS